MKGAVHARTPQRWNALEPSRLPAEDRLDLFILILFVGAYVLLVLIAGNFAGGVSEAEEERIFILGWIFAPLLSLCSLPLWTWIHQLAPRSLRKLATLNALILLLVTTGLNLGWQFTRSDDLLSHLVWAAVWIWPLANAGAIWCLRSKPAIGGHVQSTVPLLLGALSLLNFVGFFPYSIVEFPNRYAVPVAALPVAILAAAASLILKAPERRSVIGTVPRIAVDSLVVLFVVLTCFDPSLTIQADHQSFYLGPVNRLLHGGSMLVDTFSQYGVLSMYALAGMFELGLPLTFHALSLAMAALTVLQFLAVYVLLVALTPDRPSAILLLILALLLGLIGTLGASQAFPSTGPLRFGPTYLLLLLVHLESRGSRFQRFFRVLQVFVVGLASLWSVETLLYTLIPYVGICLLQACASAPTLGVAVGSFLRRMLWLALAILGAQVLFAFWTYLRAGSLPQWGIYGELVFAYAGQELGAMTINPWSPWIIPTAILFASLMSFVFRALTSRDLGSWPQDPLVLGLTLFGIVQYTYYLGRSHPNNLFHISTAPLLIAGYYLTQGINRPESPTGVRRAARAVLVCAATIIALGVAPAAAAKSATHQLGYRFAWNAVRALAGGDNRRVLEKEWQLLSNGSGDRMAREGVRLLQAHDPASADATVILTAPTTTEVLMLSGRAQTLPVSEFIGDGLSATLSARILASPARLQTGDVVLVAQYPDSYLDNPYQVLQLPLLGRICDEFALTELAHTHQEISAMRLDPHDSANSPYCDAVRELLH